MAEDRNAHFSVVIGAPARGKTSTMLYMIKDLVAKGDRVLVILPHQNEKAFYPYYPVIRAIHLERDFDPNFTGFCCIEARKGVTFPFLLDLFEKKILSNTLVVLDDPYYARKNPEPELIDMLFNQRQFCIDTWTTAHSYDNIPPVFFTYLTAYGLMYTNSPIKNRLDEVPNHPPLLLKVNEEAGTDENSDTFHLIRWYTKDGIEIE